MTESESNEKEEIGGECGNRTKLRESRKVIM